MDKKAESNDAQAAWLQQLVGFARNSKEPLIVTLRISADDVTFLSCCTQAIYMGKGIDGDNGEESPPKNIPGHGTEPLSHAFKADYFG